MDITHDNVCSSMLSCFYSHLLSTGRPISSWHLFSVIFYGFFSWYETGTGTYELVTIVNLLFRSTGSLVSAAESMLRPG